MLAMAALKYRNPVTIIVLVEFLNFPEHGIVSWDNLVDPLSA